MLRRLGRLLRLLIRPDREDRELREEIRYHLDNDVRLGVARGLSAEAARAAAVRKFGRVPEVEQAVRSARPWAWLAETRQDVRYGWRLLRKNPLLSLATVLTLSLGIGPNIGIFTVMSGLLLRPRVSIDPDRFIHLVPKYSSKAAVREERSGFSLNDYRAYQAGAHTVETLAAWSTTRTTLGEDPTTRLALLVSCGFFSLYELTRPLLGRTFLPEECSSPGGAPVVVLSERIWRRELAADPRVIGTVLLLNRHPFTVVGIAPDDFPGRLKGDFWFPFTAAATLFVGKDYFRDADTPWLTLEGRVRAGSTRRDAESELRVIAGRLDRLQRDRKTTLTVTDGSMLSELAVETPRLLLMAPLVLGALTLVLLLAGINVTVLLLSRAADRRREIAVRLAVGVGRGRLLRLLLVESLILASIAGTIGAVVAYRMPSTFTRLFPDAPFSRLTPDWTVLVYLGGITLLAGMVAGLAPALEAFRVDLAATLKGHDPGFVGSGTRRWRLRDLLIGAQVALSLVLLVGAGIFVHGEQRMAASDPGFETNHVLVVGLRPTRHYDGPEAGAFFEALERRLRAERGIRSVGFAGEPPYAVIDEEVSQGTEVRLPSEQKGSGRHAAVTVVSSEYFATLGIPIQRGRGFDPAEDNGREQALVAVVSESFARMYWPNENPLGKVVVADDNASLEVVGVARDTKTERLGVAGAVQLYRTGTPRSFSQFMLVRFDGDVATVANAVRQAVRAGDPDLLPDPQTLQFMIDQTASIVWKVASMVLMLGALAVTLAVVGIFGVVSFTVRRRTKELGIRRALGASQSRIVRMVLATGLRPIVAGIGAGLALAAAGSLVLEQTLKAMPLPVEPRDPGAFVAVSALLAATAVAAMLGPALRGARSDPNEALRQE